MDKNTDMDLLEYNERLLKAVRKRAGMDSEKIDKVVASYLQIASDNQVNFNELIQIMNEVKERVTQSLNKVSISTLPQITSDAAKL